MPTIHPPIPSTSMIVMARTRLALK